VKVVATRAKIINSMAPVGNPSLAQRLMEIITPAREDCGRQTDKKAEALRQAAH